MKNTILASCLTVAALVGCSSNEKTNQMYLIPEGHKGYVYAMYNVPGAPKLKHEGDYSVHKINSEGYFATSEPDMNYGTVNDKYFYVDKEGHRTKIDNNCVKQLGTGGLEEHTGSNNNATVDMNYTGIQIRTEGCSEEFVTEGSTFEDEDSLNVAIDKVIQKYYR